VTVTVLLLFTAGIAVIGVLHQGIWLARSGERPFTSRFSMPPEVVAMDLRGVANREIEQRKDDTYQPTGNDLRAHLPRVIRHLRTPDARVAILSGPEDRLTGLVVDTSESGARGGLRTYVWNSAKRTFDRVTVEPDRLPEFIADMQGGRSAIWPPAY
jgi:hypothetical protein